MIRLEDPTNFGCQLRDGIYANMDAFKDGCMVSMSKLKQRLEKIDIPKQYWADVLLMTDYRKYDRIKDTVEQLIEGRVLAGILDEILKEEGI